MNKIPVGETISKSYEFGFTKILSVLGILWLPYLLLFAIMAGLVFLLTPELPHMLITGQFDDTYLIAAAFRLGGIYWLLAYITGSMVTVGIQNKALGRHEGPVFVYFSLGAAVWRMAAAWFLATLVIILVVLLTGAAVGAIWFAAGQYMSSFAGLIRGVAISVAVLWIIYMSVRLVFFLPPVVVAEDRIGLGRAWELAGGNFWRIFIVFIAVFVPTAIGFGIVENIFVGALMPRPNIQPGMDYRQIIHMVFEQFRYFGPALLVIGIVRQLIFLGLGNGMIASSYLAVTGDAQGRAQTFA
ncbi:MAG: hypothetical protein ABSD74_16320 [Rhizomicrobium sp.]|jgi:hypothetical protein